MSLISACVVLIKAQSRLWVAGMLDDTLSCLDRSFDGSKFEDSAAVAFRTFVHFPAHVNQFTTKSETHDLTLDIGVLKQSEIVDEKNPRSFQHAIDELF